MDKGEDGKAITVDDQLMACENEHEYEYLAGKIVPIFRRRHHGKTEIAASDDFRRECPFQQECKLHKKNVKVYTVRVRDEGLQNNQTADACKEPDVVFSDVAKQSLNQSLAMAKPKASRFS